MSSTVIAYTIIGSKVDRCDLYVEETKDVHINCSPGTGRFCPDCGRPVNETEKIRRPLPQFGDDGLASERFGDLNFVCARFGDDDSRCFIGSLMRCARTWKNRGEPKYISEIDLNWHRERVRTALEPLGLWDPMKFGIWTALYFS